MINRVFKKINRIDDTGYQAEIVCNSPRAGEFLLYGRLLNKDGKPVPKVKLVRKKARSLKDAEDLVSAMNYEVSRKIPVNSKPKAPQKVGALSRNEIDAVVQKMLDEKVIFYTPSYSGSKHKSWNEQTHRAVYTYWLNHNFSELLLRMAKSDNPSSVLEQFRDQLIDDTYHHGRSIKNRQKAAQTVAINLARMNILLAFLRKDHPEFPAFDLTQGTFLGCVVPNEQIKFLPESMCRFFTKELEERVQTEPHYVLPAVLMYDGALRTAEAAGISIRCIVFYEHYCVVQVLYQERDGERISRLKTDNAYRCVVLSYWAMTMIRRCLDILNLDPDDDCLLLRADELSKWVREILYAFDPGYIENAEKVQRTNPDCDDDGNPVYDVSAYVLRRNAASRWRNYDGLTHDEIDIMLGHKELNQRPEKYLLDETQQQEIAAKLERYVYNPNCTRNPAFAPIEITPQCKIDLVPYIVVKIVNTSDQPLRVHSDLTACCPKEPIIVHAPEDSTSDMMYRSEKFQPKSRIVINSNYTKIQESEKTNEKK